MWPNVQPGDDIAGNQVLAFYAKGPDGKYVNISKELGITAPIPTRSIATGDTTGTGTLDFAVARQWGPPAFYANQSPNRGGYLDLHLFRPATGGDAAMGLGNVGAPAYGTTVTVSTPDGAKQVSQLDGGGGHAGYRSFDVHFGLGKYTGPVTVTLNWRDTAGQDHNQTMQLSTGAHSLMLSATAEGVSNR
jgi:hypothetical protein